MNSDNFIKFFSSETFGPHLETLAAFSTGARLAEAGLGWTPGDANAAAALRFRLRGVDSGGGGLRIVALLGGASGGKSTLFNSLVEDLVSRTSAHAHETVGPIAGCYRADAGVLGDAMANGLLFPGFERVVVDASSRRVKPALQKSTDSDLRRAVPALQSDLDSQRAKPALQGSAGAVTVYSHDLESLSGILLVDTPDITSRKSADEGDVTRQLLPFFDAVVIVVDEERFYDAAVFDDCLDVARNTGPAFFVLFNCTESGEAVSEDERKRLCDHAMSRCGAEAMVSPFVPGSGYRPLHGDAVERVRDWMGRVDVSSRGDALADHLCRRCKVVLEENVANGRRFADLSAAVDRQLDELTGDTRLTADLLTDDERRHLGVGRRFVPLYDTVYAIQDRLSGFLGGGVFGGKLGNRRADSVDFEKRSEALSGTLQRNFELRFQRATDAVDQAILDSAYVSDVSDAGAAMTTWSLPDFDAVTWAARIRDHIDQWKRESTSRAKKSDVAGFVLAGPLLLADLLFLGGAGMTLGWSVASVAALFGGKTLVAALQSSDAFKAYQTTVSAYQAFLRESLEVQCRRNLDGLPKRHLPMRDPAMQAVLAMSARR